MKVAVFLWVVIMGSSEDHWSRHPMTDMQTCERVLSTRKIDIPAGPKQVNSVLMYCGTDKEIQYTNRSWGP